MNPKDQKPNPALIECPTQPESIANSLRNEITQLRSVLDETAITLDCCWRYIPERVRILLNQRKTAFDDADRLSLYARHLDGCPAKHDPDKDCICGYNNAVSAHAKTVFARR